jgi:hypothetical protein
VTYVIERAAAPAPLPLGGAVKSEERLAMEQLNVGDAFMVTNAARLGTTRRARYALAPKMFTVRKVTGKGWQVRRTA